MVISASELRIKRIKSWVNSTATQSTFLRNFMGVLKQQLSQSIRAISRAKKTSSGKHFKAKNRG
jgi:hypothetical protein